MRIRVRQFFRKWWDVFTGEYGTLKRSYNESFEWRHWDSCEGIFSIAFERYGEIW
jgi:hypothetical protein